MVVLGRWIALLAVGLTLAGAGAASGQAFAGPSAGAAAGCGGVTFKHGVVDILGAHGMKCARAKRVVSFVLSHGLIRRGHSRARAFIVPRGPVLGFHFSLVPYTATVTAHDGSASMTLDVCWFNVDC